MLPSEAGFVKAEFEGPDIVVYLKNSKMLYENETIIRSIASAIKKKLIVRSDSALAHASGKGEGADRGHGAERGRHKGSIRFVPEFSEVYIEALKPGLVIGKGGSTLKSIAMQTRLDSEDTEDPDDEQRDHTRVRQLMFTESDFRKKFLMNIGKSINTAHRKERMVQGHRARRLSGRWEGAACFWKRPIRT